jgi:SAM-dependent methyltransferase
MNHVAQRVCPVCETSSVGTVGPILHPQPALVAGVTVDLGGTEYWLRQCPRCGFQFKDPPIDAEKLLACYAAADSANWELDPDPWQRQFDILGELLAAHAPGRRVLDVGCFNGALLSYLGDGWQRFGVEPSHEAADLARERGVNVLGATLEDLRGDIAAVDAVLAIDVVEHVVEPLPFFQAVRDRLAEGGIFLILTGNTDALAWRLQGSMYWYCSLPEHVSFYNRRALEWIARQVGFEVADFRTLGHKRMSSVRHFSDVAKSAAYIAGRRARGLGIAPLRRLFVERRGPSIQSAKDHLACVLRRI